jgi:uncharacterized membrane protein
MGETTHDTGGAPADPDTLPFVAPCRDLEPGAPLRWVRLGWQDMLAAPRQSLSYGLVVLLLSVLVSVIAWRLGSYWLLLAMLSGFVFVAPVLAIGFYSISCQLGRGIEPSLARCLFEQKRHRGAAMVFALVLLVIFLVWARAASTVSIFFPEQGDPRWEDLVPYFGIGSAVGSIFAGITFAVSAFSLPMIMDRKADAITAAVTSFNAVLRNKRAMLVWVAIIVAAVVVGVGTALLGLAVTIPLIGHATWHAYRETIDASAWPHHEEPDPT